MKQQKHIEQASLMQWCEIMSAKHPQLENIFAIPNGGHRHIGVARKLKAEGVKAGVPDIFLAIPRFYYDRAITSGLFIEMKSEKGRVSEEQKKWLYRLEYCGYKTVVCYSWVEAAKVICNYLGIEATGL